MRRSMSWLVSSLVLCTVSIVTAPAEAGIIHLYDFVNGLNDELGGPALVAEGGTVSGGSYQFGFNQGLMLTNGLPNPGHYSLVVDFAFENVSSWHKIVDFKDLTSDSGLYVRAGALRGYQLESVGPEGAFLPNTPVRLVFTRDSATQLIHGYINGVEQFVADNSNQNAIFSGPNNIMRFFRDDGAIEASAGVAGMIAIYDAPLSAAEVLQLGGPGALTISAVPEPSSMLLLGTALSIGAGYRLRRRSALPRLTCRSDQ